MLHSSPHNEREDLSLRLYLLIRLLQLSNRFVTRNPVTGLTIHESSLLLEIDSRSDCRSQDLETLFRLDQSTISRHIEKLSKLRLIKKIRSHEDKRRFSLLISPYGKEILKVHDKASNEIVRIYTDRVTKKEMNLILNLFNTLSSSLGVPAGIVRPGEHPLRSEMRRITLSLGITSAQYMGSTLSSFHWNTLAEIAFRVEVHSIQDLIDSLSISRGNISQILARLEKDTLIEKIPSPIDKRETVVKVSKKGHSQIGDICRNATMLCVKGTQSVDLEKLRESLNALRKMIGKIEDGRVILSNGYSYKLFHDSHSTPLLRTFLLECHAEAKTLHHVGETICGKDSRCALLFMEQTPVGFLEVIEQGLEEEIRNSYFSSEVPSKALVEFIQAVTSSKNSSKRKIVK